MSKKISITEQIELLEEENKSLKRLKKYFEKAVKDEFGMTINELHNLINKTQKASTIRINRGQQSDIEQSEM